LEDLASKPLPGLVVITSRFECTDLIHRKHFQSLWPGALDLASSRRLMTQYGVIGDETDLDEAISSCRGHPKAGELLGVYLARFRNGDARAWRQMPELSETAGASPEEVGVLRVLHALDSALQQESKDILALATAFRDPPTEDCLIEYLLSQPVQVL